MNNNEFNEIDAEETIKDLENKLLKTRWIEEAKQIPLEVLNPDEQTVLIKCINKEEFTEPELDLLRKTLHKYRDAIETQDPEGTIETVKENIQVIEDEKTFLKLIDQERKNQVITMYYPVNNGKEFKITLDVMPVTDSQAVLDISENLSLFKDFTEEEIKIYNDFNNKLPQTREEKIIAEQITQKINNLTQEKQVDIMKEFLARQTKFHNQNSTYESMKEVYNKMDLGYLALLFQKVQNMAGLGDIKTERVFRQFD